MIGAHQKRTGHTYHLDALAQHTRVEVFEIDEDIREFRHDRRPPADVSPHIILTGSQIVIHVFQPFPWLGGCGDPSHLSGPNLDKPDSMPARRAWIDAVTPIFQTYCGQA